MTPLLTASATTPAVGHRAANWIVANGIGRGLCRQRPPLSTEF